MRSKARRVLITIAGFAVAAWLFWQWQFPTCTFSYQLTVEIDTPEGVKSGSGILEVQFYPAFIFATGGPSWHSRVSRGEAIHVDLGSGKNLFVLLTANESGRQSYRDESGAMDADLLARFMLARLAKAADPMLKVLGLRDYCAAAGAFAGRPPAEIDTSNLPTLVTFADLNSPESLHVVLPDRIELELGSGYALRRASFQVTTDASQEKIDKLLHWLAIEKERWKEQRSFGQGHLTLDNINYDSFKEPGLWEP